MINQLIERSKKEFEKSIEHFRGELVECYGWQIIGVYHVVFVCYALGVFGKKFGVGAKTAH